MPIDLVLALTMGLLGGFGHCVGMCGPLVATLGLTGGHDLGLRRAALGQALYNLGRVTTYAFVGAVMGLAGSFVKVAGRLAGFQDVISVVAGAFMILLGLGAAGVLAPARRLEARAARRVIAAGPRLLADAGPGGYYPLGLLFGFLPCGLSYSAFVASAASGSLPGGFLFALVFALGTVPALLLAGVAAGALGARSRALLFRAGGILAALVGALYVARGLGR